jgi:hypothetical protein
MVVLILRHRCLTPKRIIWTQHKSTGQGRLQNQPWPIVTYDIGRRTERNRQLVLRVLLQVETDLHKLFREWRTARFNFFSTPLRILFCAQLSQCLNQVDKQLIYQSGKRSVQKSTETRPRCLGKYAQSPKSILRILSCIHGYAPRPDVDRHDKCSIPRWCRSPGKARLLAECLQKAQVFLGDRWCLVLPNKSSSLSALKLS